MRRVVLRPCAAGLVGQKAVADDVFDEACAGDAGELRAVVRDEVAHGAGQAADSRGSGDDSLGRDLLAAPAREGRLIRHGCCAGCRAGIADIRRAKRDDRFFDSVPGFGFLSLRIGGFRPVEMRESMLRGDAGAGEQCQQGESCE